MGVAEGLAQGHDLPPATTNTDTPSQSCIAALLEWFKTEHHGQVHNGLDIYHSDETGLSFRASVTGNAAIAAGEPVVVCPLSASLSYLNAIGGGWPLGKASHLPKEPVSAFPAAFVHKVPPHVIGRFFLIQQYLLGPSSPWAPYISALPEPHDFDAWALPAVWPSEGRDGTALTLLEGTNAEVAAAEIRQRIDDEFREAWPLLQDDDIKIKYTLSLYKWAYCIFTSRSFRPSLVLTSVIQAALTRSEADDAVDRHHLSMINHVRLPPDCSIDDFSLLLPVLDIGNHDPRSIVKWQPVVDASRTALTSSALLNSIPSATRDHAVAFSTGAAHSNGQPVFNNYGCKTNSELLVGYGFVLAPAPDLHNDYVHLRKRGELGPRVSETDFAAGTSTDAVHRDFLLSLRPMASPASPVGRARLAPAQWADDLKSSTRRSPGFALVDDGLLWDMLSLMLQPGDREEVQRYASAHIAARSKSHMAPTDLPLAEIRETILDLAFGTQCLDIPTVLQKISSQVRMTLLYKLDADLEKLLAKDATQETLPIQTRRDRLALQYRQQYIAVLNNAINVLGREVDNEAEEEDDD
ncbi:hypothetical protein SEPCBS119000_004779 [Sporothrix epigloea]|uniref:SET domain-containing protein n=1 Tax=Sporothrix epigloea TaxID=1892477 RepID=A0ABP0DW63_9PEZI